MSPAAAAAAKSLQSCPTLCDPIDGNPPGSSVHGIFQARVLEWGAIAFSKYESYPWAKYLCICLCCLQLVSSVSYSFLGTVLFPPLIYSWVFYSFWCGFPDSSDGKESACNAEHPGSIPGSGRFPGKGNGNTIQYSFLENPMARLWCHKESDTTIKLGILVLLILKEVVSAFHCWVWC